MKLEAHKNYYLYLPFVIGASIDNLMRGFKNYVTRKQYNTSSGDLVPVIAARALKICLIVLKNIQSVYNLNVIEHHSDEDKFFLVKTGDHYDAVVLINFEPLGVENNVERLVVTDIMFKKYRQWYCGPWRSYEYWRWWSPGIVILQPRTCSSGGERRSRRDGELVGLCHQSETKRVS